MNILSYALAGAALMAGTVIYGTDVFCAIVQRPALARVDDRTLTSMMGRVHQYGDRRLPVPGALSVIAAALAAITAGLAGRAAAAGAAGGAVAALVVWLIIYVRVSAPVNHRRYLLSPNCLHVERWKLRQDYELPNTRDAA